MKERAYPVYTVNKHAEGLLVGGHPWVYENDILGSPEAEPENGTLVDVVSTKGAYLGTGFLSLKSKIRVRLISRNANDTFDAAFWKRRVEYAWAYRKTVLEPADLTACRVIFGEADQFPGLTVDRFNNILVTQTLSVGMEKLKPILFPLLAEVLRADGQTIEGIYERNDEALRAKEGLAQNKGWFDLPGETHPDSTQTEICENGVFYHVDFENGQKTGFFLDQKYNRRAVARIAAGHTVLDCFTHTGSFALNAAKGGAARVTAADISAEAIAMAQRNAQEETERATTVEERTAYTLELLGKMLNLPEPPKRMESFDISNTGKSDIVASMVVYVDGRPKKSDYRRFKLKNMTGPDDYASMQEVLRRRLQRAADGDEKFLPLPDVFLIDGGETHARAAQTVAWEFGVDVPIFGMVKDDRHRTRALVHPDGREIGIQAVPALFAFIGQIQEETHRSAVGFHHKRHTKSGLGSTLERIPGIGEARRKKLLKAFGSVKAIRQADLPALEEVLPKAAARAVYEQFRTKEEETTCASSQARPGAGG